MSVATAEEDVIVRNIPLDKCVKPEHDVRENRGDTDVDTIVESIERSGQIHAAFVYPVNPDGPQEADEWRELDLQEKYEEAEIFRVVDGWTRRLALERLGRETMRCEVHHERPEDPTVVSLEANTVRIDMSDYETIRALKEMADRQGLTHDEVAERVGKSRSHITNLFKVLEASDPVVEEWQNDDTHITASHVAAIMQLPTPDEEVRMLRQVLRHELSVGKTRETVQNRLKMIARREAAADQDRDRRAEGMDETASETDQHGDPADDEPPDCRITGDPAYTHVTIPVSEAMYSTVQRLRETDESLLEALGLDEDETDDDDDPDDEIRRALTDG